MEKLKSQFVKTIVFLSCFIVSLTIYGQADGTVELSEFTKNKEMVTVSIKTSDSFVIGANRYVLHIGGKYFLRSQHPEGRLDEIHFFIPLDDFNMLEEGKAIVLVYGLYQENTQQDGESSQTVGFTGKHWNLGPFSSAVLTDE